MIFLRPCLRGIIVLSLPIKETLVSDQAPGAITMHRGISATLTFPVINSLVLVQVCALLLHMPALKPME